MIENRFEIMPLVELQHAAEAAFIFRRPEASRHKDALIETVRDVQKRSKGLHRTNCSGGWHSNIDLPQWKTPATEDLMSFIAACADDVVASINRVSNQWRESPWISQACANVNPPGGAANVLHEHIMKNWHWSGCYYVQCGRPMDISNDSNHEGKAGRLVFERRWLGLHLNGQQVAESPTLTFAPEEGDLILFPSWQHHRVEPHMQEADRISIAFNLHSPQLEKSRYWTQKPGWIASKLPTIYYAMNGLLRRDIHSPSGTPPGYPIG